MRYLLLSELLLLHSRLLKQSGGADGIRDMAALESATAQPFATFDGVDLYTTLVEKAAALCFSIISNHPFVDGNKRVGHAAMEIFLVLNGYELHASTEEQEKIVFDVAAGRLGRNELVTWLGEHVQRFHEV